mmetsp:Transcript_139718/g.243282  ORF Transcript_139718/g.243282 Transcript_139718/m.243282 type:complete len:475 (-) Transcript_139718:59-1483(-)
MHTQQDSKELLRLSMDLTRQAYFIEAKTALAAYSRRSSATREEVYSQVAHMRWRMGLQTLEPSEVDSWLHPGLKATQQDAAELEWIEIPSALPRAVVERRTQYNSWSTIGNAQPAMVVLICAAVLIGFMALAYRSYRVRRAKGTSPLRWSLSSLQTSGALVKQAASIFKMSLRTSGCATICTGCPLAQIKEAPYEGVISDHSVACALDAFSASEVASKPVTVSPGIDEKSLNGLEHLQAEELVDDMPDASETRTEGLEKQQQVALEKPKCPEMLTSIEELTTAEGSEASYYSDAHSEALHESTGTVCSTRRKFTMSETTFVESVDRQSFATEVIGIRVRELAREAFGCDDELTHLKKSERIAVLLLAGEAVAYATYIVRRDLRSLGIGKLAVAGTLRQQGLGRILLRNLISSAKKRSRGQVPLDVISLSSLASSVQFYRSCGFREETSVDVHASEDVIEGQVYMEYRLQQRRGR